MNNKRYAIAIIGGILGMVAIIVYYSINPAETIWMPKCPFKLLTGLDCPACGGQRAMHAFLHGNLSEAILFNPFLIISLPYFFAVLYTTFCKSNVSRRLYKYVQHRYTVIGYLVLFIAWWIVRNI